ncbi:MAG: hypothetical protein HWE25_07875 [Alphaproteobacteria bacterium]|nr:hypothetical protein [Alphaproteobacteria bacterium]
MTSDRTTTPKLSPRLSALAVLILGVALTRLLPHPPNFTPILALGLFGGAMFDRKHLGFVVPLAAMLISDLCLELMFGYGIHGLMPVIYGLVALSTVLGFLMRGKLGIAMVIGLGTASSALFFLGSNFAVWLGSTKYPQTLEGLLACYTAATPFFQNTLLGTFAYAALMFGGWAIAEKRIPVLANTGAPA